jgi:hypothetical protein
MVPGGTAYGPKDGKAQILRSLGETTDHFLCASAS